MDLCITDNLIFMRHKHGYTMEALAEIISVSRQTVAKWESGESYPDIMNCMKLATLYKITLDELVYKPLKEAQMNEYSSGGNKICGVLDVAENGAVYLPEVLLEMFDMKVGDKVLLLADRREGIAIVKCSQF
jgi:DNA-binding XRE family transcriptional regulator